jgi:hypothetical protein
LSDADRARRYCPSAWPDASGDVGIGARRRRTRGEDRVVALAEGVERGLGIGAADQGCQRGTGGEGDGAASAEGGGGEGLEEAHGRIGGARGGRRGPPGCLGEKPGDPTTNASGSDVSGCSRIAGVLEVPIVRVRTPPSRFTSHAQIYPLARRCRRLARPCRRPGGRLRHGALRRRAGDAGLVQPDGALLQPVDHRRDHGAQHLRRRQPGPPRRLVHAPASDDRRPGAGRRRGAPTTAKRSSSTSRPPR